MFPMSVVWVEIPTGSQALIVSPSLSDLNNQAMISKEQASKYEKLYRQAETQNTQLEQKLKRELEASQALWRDEK